MTYLITPSLLNSWLYISTCIDGVKEASSDEISLEDKQDLAIAKAKEDFIKTLNRVKSEPNQYMLEGIKYEEETYKGNTRASPYVKGGAFQFVGMKEIEVDGMKFLMYGRLDCLKAGVIYDIKKVVRYARQKYLKSAQHGFYLELVPRAKIFTYLIDDGKELHTESYYPEECVPTEVYIHNFIQYLIQNDLIEIYKEKWQSKKG